MNMMTQNLNNKESEKMNLKDMVDNMILKIKNQESKILSLENNVLQQKMEYGELKSISEAKLEGQKGEIYWLWYDLEY